MTLKESAAAALEAAGFTVLDGYERYDSLCFKYERCAFISGGEVRLLEQWTGTDGVRRTAIRRELHITAFAASQESSAALCTAAEQLLSSLALEQRFSSLSCTVSPPKRDAVHGRMSCTIEISSAELLDAADGEVQSS